MLGVHSGFTENQIDEFTLKHYRGCMKELNLKLRFDGIKSIVGNAYVPDAGKIVSEYNPFNYLDNPNGKMHRMTKEMALAFIGKRK